MLRKIMTDSLWYTIANIITKGISFLLIPIYTTYFSPTEYGVIDLLIILGTIISTIIGLEIHQAVARFFPEENTYEDKKVMVSTALWSIICFYFLFLVIALPFSKELSNILFDNEKYERVIVVAMVSFGFNFLYYFVSSQLKWQLETKKYVFISLIYSVSLLLTTFLFLFYFEKEMEFVFLAQILSALVCIILSYLFTKKYYNFIFNVDMFIKLFTFSLPLIFSTLMVYAMLYVDRMMINIYMSIEEVGLYGVAFRVASIVALLSTGVQTALTPLLYNYHMNSETPFMIAKLFNYIMISALGIIVFLFFFSSEIVFLFTNEAYMEASVAVPWIAISLLFSAITNLVPGIFIAKKTKYILYINLFCFLLNILLNLLLIQSYGFVGAAYATTLSSVTYFFLYYHIGQKYYFIPFVWTKVM